jgi:hypothetical protein
MNHPSLFPIKFHPGQVYMTRSVADLGIDPTPFLDRHVRGDWGDDLDFGDQQANDADLAEGGRLLSKYRVRPGVSIYIITEHDRSVTTLMLPEEY